MIVRHERSGGYAGITVNVEVDSATLPAKHANELRAGREGVSFRPAPEETSDDAGSIQLRVHH